MSFLTVNFRSFLPKFMFQKNRFFPTNKSNYCKFNYIVKEVTNLGEVNQYIIVGKTSITTFENQGNNGNRNNSVNIRTIIITIALKKINK